MRRDELMIDPAPASSASPVSDGGPLAAPAPGEVHLYIARPEELTAPAAIARYEAMMAPEERARQARFVFARHRHEYLVTRALVRTVLSRYANVAPAGWRFRANEYGRPEIDMPASAGVPPLRFNLSNTDGMVVCGVTLDREIGVDVEPLDRPVPLEVADRYFAPSEVAELRAQPAAAQPRRFLDYWTLKESYIKARGMGLSIPLDQFALTIDAAVIRITFTREIADDPARWRFAQVAPAGRHLVAVAVEVRASDRAAAASAGATVSVRSVAL
jgi:4'-phosphopantetheinyl transferase